MIKFIGDIDNWMDFRDLLIRDLENCDTELKFERLLNHLVVSLSVNPEGINKVRESLGVPKLSTEEISKLNEFFK